jgi:hypothetical protein
MSETSSNITPKLKYLMENPPETPRTPARDYLRMLDLSGPRGFWMAPLTDEQLASAEVFGKTFFTGSVPQTGDNPFLVEFPKQDLIIQIKTPFSRIAEYVGRTLLEGGSPDAEAIAKMNVQMASIEELQGNKNFVMETRSRHKTVSVVHIRRDGRIQSMENIGRSTHAEIQQVTFTMPMPEPDDFGDIGVEFFEFYIPGAVFRKAHRIGFTFDFYDLR